MAAQKTAPSNLHDLSLPSQNGARYAKLADRLCCFWPNQWSMVRMPTTKLLYYNLLSDLTHLLLK